MRGRPGSRRIAVAVVALLSAAAMSACGSRAPIETASAAVAPPVLATVPAPLPAPPPPPPPPVLVTEDVSAPMAMRSGPVEVPAGIEVVGRMVIPRIGVDTPLLEGEELHVLEHGPGHRAGTADPGQLGNVVVAGHRTTYTRPFRNLDALEPGDPLVFETPTGVYHYVFAVHQVVGPSQVEITNQPNGYIATLYACHPPGSARSRLVAYFRLVSAPELGQPDPATVEVVPLPLA